MFVSGQAAFTFAQLKVTGYRDGDLLFNGHAIVTHRGRVLPIQTFRPRGLVAVSWFTGHALHQNFGWRGYGLCRRAAQ